ncbi:MAG TPA: hypothetical protein VH459_05980 [Gaiellales bacterium]|jgi:hypothetical protein
MKVRLILAAAVAGALVFGVSGVAFSDGSPTIKGMVGGDFDTQLPPGGQNGADWGVDASFARPANTVIHDGDVKVVGGGDSNDSFSCTGSVTNPTAPKGKVCIYLLNSGNAANIRGVTPAPGTDGSRFGFKLIWDANGNGDTFVDAVWAYHFH